MTITADQLRDDIVATLKAADFMRQVDRAPGLSISSLGVCTSRGIRENTGEDGSSDQDPWNAMRGTYLHAGIAADFETFGKTDIIREEKVSVQIAGITLSGHPDEVRESDDCVVEYKTRDRGECNHFRVHGPDRANAMQTATYARARGKGQAFLVYVPVQGTFDDWVVFEIDVDHWFGEAETWLRGVLEYDGPVDEAPRDKPSTWCEVACPFFDNCRGDHHFSMEDEITDPDLAYAMQVSWAAKQDRLEAEKTEKAANAVLGRTTGRFGHLRRVRTTVEGTATRAPYDKHEIKETSDAKATRKQREKAEKEGAAA
jgi:hypothetical protein